MRTSQDCLCIPESPETRSEGHSFYYILTMENREDDNEHNEDRNSVHISNIDDSGLYYCMNCDVTVKNGLESINHIGQMHASWIK